MSDDRPPPDPAHRDYELDDQLAADTPERLKALGDPLRMEICDLLLERAMTVSEIAERVDRPRGTVAYHVDVLSGAGLVKTVRTRRVRAIEERFYGRTARTYVLPSVEGEMPFLSEMLAEIDHHAFATRHDSAVGLATLRHARIPEDRVKEYAERLLALALEFVEEPRHGDVQYGMYLALYPTNRGRS